jgi:hypothetical protein
MVDVLVAGQVVVLIEQVLIMLIAVIILEVVTITPEIEDMILDIVDALPAALAVPAQVVVVVEAVAIKSSNMLYFPIILLIFLGLVLITRPVTVLLHELGHAIPAILLTRQKVTIYIGSHGDPKKSLKFKLGLLEGYFRYNPFDWNRGLCVPSARSI